MFCSDSAITPAAGAAATGATGTATGAGGRATTVAGVGAGAAGSTAGGPAAENEGAAASATGVGAAACMLKRTALPVAMKPFLENIGLLFSYLTLTTASAPSLAAFSLSCWSARSRLGVLGI